MREIKFRAWDGLRMTTSGIMFNTSTGRLEIPTAYSLNLEEIPKEKRMILMQYTGFKDKNGTEIWEYDIIQDGDGNKFTIWFDDGAILYGGFEKEWDDYALLMPNDITVIGNKYENPELIK